LSAANGPAGKARNLFKQPDAINPGGQAFLVGFLAAGGP